MGTCISKFDCKSTKSSAPVLPQKQVQPQHLPQPAAIEDKLVIHSSSPLSSTSRLADSSSSLIDPLPALLTPSLSATQSTISTTGNSNSSSISCTSSSLSNVSTSSSISHSSSTTTASSDEFQPSTVKKQHSKPRPTIQNQRKKPPPEPPKHPSHREAPTNNTSSCPQQQKSSTQNQRLQHTSRSTKASTAPKRDHVVGIKVSKTRCSSESNCYVKTQNRQKGDRTNVRPSDDSNKRRKEMVKQKKTENRVHHAQLPDQIVDFKGSGHIYSYKEDMDNSLVALDCFIFL